MWGNIVCAEKDAYLLFYRFWRYASSAWIRRPFPRRPWPQVRWAVCRLLRGSSPLPLSSGWRRLAAVGSLPPLPAKPPSVSAGPIHAQVKRSSCDARLPHAPARKQSSSYRTPLPNSPRTRDYKQPKMVSSNRDDPSDTAKKKKKLSWEVLQNFLQFEKLSLRHRGIMWQHLEVWVWPTFQVTSESRWCQSSQQKPCKDFLLHLVALLDSNTQPQTKIKVFFLLDCCTKLIYKKVDSVIYYAAK